MLGKQAFLENRINDMEESERKYNLDRQVIESRINGNEKVIDILNVKLAELQLI